MSLIKLKSKLLEDKIKEATGLKKEQFEKVLRNRQLDTLIIFHADVGCNQNCLHCFAQPENNADLELIEKNMLQAKELGYRVGLYATEPTIEPRLLHLYKKTDEPIIITNGIDTASMLGEFEKIGIQALGISLHGPDPETHALLTGRPEKFENIVDTVKKAKDRFYIQIKMVIHRENMDKLEEQLQFVKTLGANELQIINLIKVGEAATNLAESLFLKTSDTIYIVSEVMKLKERSNTPHITFAQSWGPNFYSRGVYNWLIGKAYLNKVPSNRWCPASKNYFTVENNDVYACPNACILPELKIGVWDNENGLQITKDFWKDELSDKLTGMCSPDNCEYSRICQGGCRAFAFAYTKNFYGSPPFCLTKIIEQLI